jgi:hypothetical protein
MAHPKAMVQHLQDYINEQVAYQVQATLKQIEEDRVQTLAQRNSEYGGFLAQAGSDFHGLNIQEQNTALYLAQLTQASNKTQSIPGIDLLLQAAAVSFSQCLRSDDGSLWTTCVP